MKIEHKMPTSKQMRDEIQRKLDADELLGASHVPEIKARVGDDRVVGFHPTLCAPYGRSAVFGDSQRRVSPHFPTIAEALVRRQRKNETIAARVLLALTGTFLLASPFAEHPWWMAGAAAACAIGFVITCIVAGSRHDQGDAYGTGSNVP